MRFSEQKKPKGDSDKNPFGETIRYYFIGTPGCSGTRCQGSIKSSVLVGPALTQVKMSSRQGAGDRSSEQNVSYIDCRGTLGFPTGFGFKSKSAIYE